MIIHSGQTAKMCGCGQSGCAEVTASAINTSNRYNQLVKSQDDITTEQIFELADKENDSIAMQVLDEVCKDV